MSLLKPSIHLRSITIARLSPQGEAGNFLHGMLVEWLLPSGPPTDMAKKGRVMATSEVQDLDPEEELQAQLTAMRNRQIYADALIAAQLELADQVHQNGEAWVRPTGAHDAYRRDAEVVKDGKTWISLTPFNVWEPGLSGWREKEGAGGGYPAWVQPTGAHDAYGIGSTVSHKGSNWTCVVAANTWEPGVYGWVPAGS